MAHPPEKRMEVRTAYIGGLPLEAAADQAGVPYPTARNWFRAAREAGDDWDKFRAASLIVAGGGIEQAMGRVIAAGLQRCEALLDRLDDDAANPDSKLSAAEAVKAMATLGDTVAKLRASGKTLMPEADKLGVAMDVVKRLNAYIKENHPQQALAFADLLGGFGEELARAYG